MRSAVSGQRSAGSDQPSAVSEPLLHDREVGRRPGIWCAVRLLAVVTINLFVALLWLGLLTWLIGRVLTDRFAWSQWLWWIPTPAALAAAVMGFLLSFRAARTSVRRRRRIMIWTACAIGIAGYFALIEHRLLHAAPSVPVEGLKIAHWNMTLDNHADIPGLMRSLDSLDADVLALTSPPSEVNRLLHEQAASSEGRLHILDGWPVMLVSRLPILQSRILVATDRMYVTQVELDAGATLGRPLTLDLVDLPSSPRLPRMGIARAALALLDSTKANPPDIAIGDFNIPRGSASLDVLFPNMLDAYDEAGHGYGASFHRRFPLYHIDHILLNQASGLRAARYDVIDEGQSRHRAQEAWIVNPSPRGG